MDQEEATQGLSATERMTVLRDLADRGCRSPHTMPRIEDGINFSRSYSFLGLQHVNGLHALDDELTATQPITTIWSQNNVPSRDGGLFGNLLRRNQEDLSSTLLGQDGKSKHGNNPTDSMIIPLNDLPSSSASAVENMEEKGNPRTPLSKYWCVTSFKESIPHDYDPEKISYIIFQQEETKTDRKHWQIYVEFTNKVRPDKVKKYFNDNAAHCELRRGTAQEAANYCRKKDSAIANTQFEAGVISKAKVNQMDDLREFIQKGASISQVADQHTGMFLRYNKSIDRLISMRDYTQAVSYKPIQVICLYGPPGCGKTRYVHDFVTHNYAGIMFSKYYEKGQPSWWDGYVDQKVILIDDFEGDAPINELLQLLDGYGHNKLWPIKGSFIKINPEIVMFTSNSHPRQWYAASQSANKVDALLRRFTSIHTCEIGSTSLLFRP